DHAGHVTAPCTVPDQIPTHRDEDGADKIERRVDRRKIGNTHDLFVRLSEVETSLTILDAGHSRTAEKRRTDGRSTTHCGASYRRKRGASGGVRCNCSLLERRVVPREKRRGPAMALARARGIAQTRCGSFDRAGDIGAVPR